ncbi:MAG TPA: hypothetical protein VFD01_21550 [Candidatus Dormibacteraeota bacterium]|jgi:hypothetical protein|nr:hypothetical protein [Candidatus Dormibacteraeota bacterium]
MVQLWRWFPGRHRGGAAAAVCLALTACTAEYQGTVTVPVSPSPGASPLALASASPVAPTPRPSSPWTPLQCRWAVVVLEKEGEGEPAGDDPASDPRRWRQLEKLVRVTVCRDGPGPQEDPATPPPGSYDGASGTLTSEGCAWATTLLEEARRLHEQAIGQPPTEPDETQAEHDRRARQAAEDDDRLIDLLRESCSG